MLEDLLDFDDGPPYIIIPMPLNSKGQGPAYPFETVRTVYQIWNICNNTVSEHPTEQEAQIALEKLNAKTYSQET